MEPSEAAPTLSPWERRLVIGADHAIYWLAAHWLALFSLLLALFVTGAFLAPALHAWGQGWLGDLLFRPYHFVCHQKPERSFFVLGYQMAMCQRDLAIFAGLLLGSLLYGLSGRRLWLRGWRPYLLVFVLPITLDGVSQLTGLRESNWWLRLATGGWFGVGTVLVTYHLIDDAMQDTRRELEERFGVGLERLGATSLRR